VKREVPINSSISRKRESFVSQPLGLITTKGGCKSNFGHENRRLRVMGEKQKSKSGED